MKTVPAPRGGALRLAWDRKAVLGAEDDTLSGALALADIPKRMLVIGGGTTVLAGLFAIAYGVSMGGYAAFRFTGLLGAARVIVVDHLDDRLE